MKNAANTQTRKDGSTMANISNAKKFAVLSMAINFYLSHKSAYIGVAESNGQYLVIPKSK